jgi:hypothetical protein
LLPHRSQTVRPVDWELLRVSLGIRFPADYLEYAGRYWGLSFDDFMTILVPKPGMESSYVASVSETLELMVSLAEDDMAEDCRFHPEENGLFPWGTSDRGTSSSGARTARTPTGGRPSSTRRTATGGNTTTECWHWSWA